MRTRRPLSKTRVVLYVFFGEGLDKARRAALDCERSLAAAKAAGTITNYDDGRDRDPWFEGPPGAGARALRDQFVAAGYRLRTRDER